MNWRKFFHVDRKIVGAFLAGMAVMVLLHGPLGLFGQAPSGYTKLNTTPVTATAFTDTTPKAGQATSYVVTAVDSFNRESLPSNMVSGMTPTTGTTHQTVLNWNETTPNVTFNVYFLVQPPPAAPAGLTGVFSMILSGAWKL